MTDTLCNQKEPANPTAITFKYINEDIILHVLFQRSEVKVPHRNVRNFYHDKLRPPATYKTRGNRDYFRSNEIVFVLIIDDSHNITAVNIVTVLDNYFFLLLSLTTSCTLCQHCCGCFYSSYYVSLNDNPLIIARVVGVVTVHDAISNSVVKSVKLPQKLCTLM